METSAAIFTDAWQLPLFLRLLLPEPSPSFATTQQKQEILWTLGNKLVMDCPFSCMLTTCKKWQSRNLNHCWTFHILFCFIAQRIDCSNESSPLLQQVRCVNALSTLEGTQKPCCDSFFSSCTLKTEPTCARNAPENGNSMAKRNDVRFHAARFWAVPGSFAECLKLKRLKGSKWFAAWKQTV